MPPDPPPTWRYLSQNSQALQETEPEKCPHPSVPASEAAAGASRAPDAHTLIRSRRALGAQHAGLSSAWYQAHWPLQSPRPAAHRPPRPADVEVATTLAFYGSRPTTQVFHFALTSGH